MHRDFGVVIYHRWGDDLDGRLERFIVALTFSDADRLVDIPFFTNGTWIDVLNGVPVEVRDFHLSGACLASNWGAVFLQRA